MAKRKNDSVMTTGIAGGLIGRPCKGRECRRRQAAMAQRTLAGRP
ncbi:hypothetical protein [Adlercreutzia sp. ZJ138]|nr:hypothetical protein [Adlercreutzia sp. ZJ138]